MIDQDVKSSFWLNLCSSILFIIFSIYLLFKPYSTTTFISRFLGGILIILGIFALVKHLKREEQDKKMTLSLILMIVSFILSIILFAKPMLINNGFQVFFGVIMVIFPFAKLKYSSELHRVKNSNYGLSVLILIIMFGLGIILLVNPTSTVFSNNQIIATLLIYYCILNVIVSLLYKNNIKDLEYEEVEKPKEKEPKKLEDKGE